MAPPKRRSSSEIQNSDLQIQDDNPFTSSQNDHPPERSENQDDVDGNYCDGSDEECDTVSVHSADRNTPNTTPEAPEWPPRDEEDYDDDESYNTPAEPRPVTENMNTYNVGAGYFREYSSKHSNSRSSTPEPPSPKRPRWMPTVTFKRDSETPEPSSFATAGGLDGFQNKIQQPVPTHNTPPPAVPHQQSMQYNPERYPFTAASLQYASSTYPRMATGFQNSSMVNNARSFVPHNVLPSRFPPRDTPIDQNPSMPHEWNAQGHPNFHRPWANRPSSMGGGAQATISLNDPFRINNNETINSQQEATAPAMWSDAASQDVTYPYRPSTMFDTQNSIRRSPPMPVNISSYTETEIIMRGFSNSPPPNNTAHYGTSPYVNPGANCGSFSGRNAAGSQSHLNSFPGTPTESPQSGSFCRLARPCPGRQTCSNLGRFPTHRHPHPLASQSSIRINFSASGISIPAPMERSLPPGASSPPPAFPTSPQNHDSRSPYGSIIHRPPTQNVPTTMAALLQSINRMVDSITKTIQQGGAYGYPPGPPRDN